MSAKQFARAYHAGNFVEAEKLAIALVERDRRNAMAWQGPGAARLNQRRPQEALQALETSLGYEPPSHVTGAERDNYRTLIKKWEGPAELRQVESPALVGQNILATRPLR